MTTIGFLGTGNMGGAIIKGLAKRPDVKLVGFDVSRAKLDELSAACGLAPKDSAQEAAAVSDVLFLCVKPYGVKDALSAVREHLLPGCVIVSIAAGVNLDKLSKWAGDEARVVRVMPNTPALVGAGQFAVCPQTGTPAEVAELVRDLLGSIGQVFEMPEKLMDAYTGLAGCGPAFVCYILDAFVESGVAVGLSRDQSFELTTGLFSGTLKLIEESGLHLAQLREMVTSPGGATSAGLRRLDVAAVRGHLVECVAAAAKRSKELGD